MTAKKDTKFKPGQSGNPGGRTPGTGWVAEARKALEKEWDGKDGIKSVLIKRAKEGDMVAIRLVAERVCPPIRATEPATPIELPEGTLTDRATAVLNGLAQGDLNTSQASQLMGALGFLAKVIETEELATRIAALEEKHGSQT
jgi:hypothetical protein